MMTMAMDRLSCGTLVDDLWDQVADRGPIRSPDHQAECSECAAALGEIRARWAPVQAVAQERVRAPDDMVGAVLRRLRAITGGTGRAVVVSDRGVTQVACTVLAALARQAALGVPDVGAALAQVWVAPRGEPGQTLDRPSASVDEPVPAGQIGDEITVDLGITLSWASDIARVADQVRHTVADQVGRLGGLPVQAVDVTVVDVVRRPIASAPEDLLGTRAPGRADPLGSGG